MLTEVKDSANLWYYGDNSDKVYHVQIKGDALIGYVVVFKYGRRGGHMTEGSKTKLVPLEKAREVFEKLVDSKLRKGYEYF